MPGEVRVLTAGGRVAASTFNTPAVRVLTAGGRVAAFVASGDQPSGFEDWNGSAWVARPVSQSWTGSDWT